MGHVPGRPAVSRYKTYEEREAERKKPKPPHYSNECMVLSLTSHHHCADRSCENPLHLDRDLGQGQRRRKRGQRRRRQSDPTSNHSP